MPSIKKLLFGISPKETLCSTRGFDVTNPKIKANIEMVGESFTAGYHAALIDANHPQLQQNLATINKDFQGFAYEGAGMAIALLDLLTPWRANKLNSFIKGIGNQHTYMIHVGAGWAMAKIPWGMSYLHTMDPLLRWLAIDGYGFHQGYFHWPISVTEQQVPHAIKGYAKHAFDQGLGRSLWFVKGANPSLITITIQTFPQARHADLWSGVGLAAGYAGGVNQTILESLLGFSAPYQAQLAQGVAFAAKTRLRAENLVMHTELACQVICDMSATAAAQITDTALHDLVAGNNIPAYEVWRQRIQQHFI
ncbi:MAG: enediyne biosynthesis protein E3 [Methyloprofundus sp.]|nr:MAG: enediyne biosynthesis protein E3 [Methyloprofundus sp.]